MGNRQQERIDLEKQLAEAQDYEAEESIPETIPDKNIEEIRTKRKNTLKKAYNEYLNTAQGLEDNLEYTSIFDPVDLAEKAKGYFTGDADEIIYHSIIEHIDCMFEHRSPHTALFYINAVLLAMEHQDSVDQGLVKLQKYDAQSENNAKLDNDQSRLLRVLFSDPRENYESAESAINDVIKLSSRLAEPDFPLTLSKYMSTSE